MPLYAWVVYTNNPNGTEDTAYIAHFLTEEGEYITGVPIREPSGAETRYAAGTEFLFMGMEESSWTGEVTLYDGRVRELTVPTMVDPETGIEYLADPERKIACADYADFQYEDAITIRQMDEDGRFADNELITYASYIDIWDFYDSTGWRGPDGEGTATLLLISQSIWQMAIA